LQAPPAPPPFIASVGGVAVIYQLGPNAECNASENSPLFELAGVLVRSDHVARFIINANGDWIIGRFRFRTVRPVWFRQGKNLWKNLRAAGPAVRCIALGLGGMVVSSLGRVAQTNQFVAR
jgi:hypothetical protein